MPLKISIRHVCDACDIEVAQNLTVTGLSYPVKLPGVEIAAPLQGWTHVGDRMFCPMHPQKREPEIEVVSHLPSAAETVRQALRGVRR